ncbi:RNA 2',3'-cyclic phosphodiesterase [Sideroxydans lithotrophicus]|uniref:RNA 2',3'-cyclic phosphodiesterase n=1 Tax=Sideroxydans lithotrophicus (strain ES-1) TaxID=580332 RepID=D5CLI8_SIDLE|nr:RNA 2',3'-cyclic phosphodiesterase [Sideroxydans lithotrophicus]ADE10576.1 2'-5' RNA ligase [Sideroxydans lithotrophicus ES-1]
MESKEKETVLRLFFALWPNTVERTALAAWQPPLRESCGGRAMLPDTLHTTLVFVGNVAEHRLETLRLAAQEVSGRGFGLDLTEAHYWGHNHIVYAAPQTVPVQLADLVIDLEHSLRKHRFHFEQRPYKPHVTLLRNAQWSEASLPAMRTVRWRIEDFVLVHSLSDEQGARYEVLARFPLQGGD